MKKNPVRTPQFARLSLEPLEDRLMPSTTGIPWPDPAHLTLSFAPDGTQINGTASNLLAMLNKQAPTATWQRTILQAVQSWAATTNINVGVVSDGGQPFGTTGALEGDSRFGDIRIGAEPLGNGTVGIGAPFQWDGTTWSGDIILNSKYTFGINGTAQYDLFTVIAHEAGHAFGIEDTTASTSSVMYASYNGAKTGLSSQDIGDIQSLYGVRSPDRVSNNQLSTATPIGSQPTAFVADIASTSDVDYYQLATPLALGLSGFTVTLQTSHFSSLLGSLAVYDASGHLVASTAATDPMNGDLVLQVRASIPLTTYYIRVGSNTGSVFGVGSYRLAVDYVYDNPLFGLLGSVTGAVGDLVTSPWTFVNDLGANNSLGTAALLAPLFASPGDARFQYLYQGNISDSSDTDYFQLHSFAGGQTMTAMVWSMDATNPLYPRISVFDAHQNPIPVDVLANDNGSYSIQITNVAANAVYYVKVAALNPNGSNNAGNYFLGVNFHSSPAAALATMYSGTIAQGASTDSGTLTVNQSGLINLRLTASTGSTTDQSSLEMSILDSKGDVVAILTTNGQPPVTSVVYLQAGKYTVKYQVSTPGGAEAPSMNYWLDGEALSDPMGTYPAQPNAPPPSNPPPNYSYSPSGGSTASSGSTPPQTY
jgi:hypothetical protein